MPVKIKFAKCNPNAIIPSRKEGSAGLDVYACLSDNEDAIIIDPHTCKLIPTGIKSVIQEDYFILLEERGSTGSKGIKKNCGIIDADYRGEWFVCIYNANNYSIAIVKDSAIDNYKNLFGDKWIIYPSSKAICQALVLPTPEIEVEEWTEDQVNENITQRGDGKLGSSGK